MADPRGFILKKIKILFFIKREESERGGGRRKRKKDSVMDFDLRLFFETPPRFREEVKRHMHDLATRIVLRVANHANLLGIERIHPRHARIILAQMCQDPLPRCNRSGLCLHNSKIKPMNRVFCRVMDITAKSEDAKNGGIDRKIVKGTLQVLANNNVKSAMGGGVFVAACVAEVCGIMLNAAHNMTNEKTVSMESLQNYACQHKLASGHIVENASLMRFIRHVDSPILVDLDEFERLQTKRHKKEDANEADGDMRYTRPPTLQAKHGSWHVKERSVHFEQPPRPSTPTNCFWED